jgi:hypothetical protein
MVIETERTSETSITLYHTALRNIPSTTIQNENID